MRGRGLDFDEFRRHPPGDGPRATDWKITWRTGKPHARVWVVVDMSDDWSTIYPTQ
jgi:uncharacterized protein (DUF58 family)